MRILSFLIILLFMSFMNQQTKSPHGADFRISCSKCHSSKGWFLDREIYSFDHNKTAMKLKGQHSGLDCRQCHKTLIFSEARSNCFDCHSDIHQGTTGGDCSRCHSSESWLVSNIIDIHNLSRFPLLGAHRTADCIQCHKSESLVRFDVAGINCIDCHRQDYLATTNPNHQKSGMSTDCEACHKINSIAWTGTTFNHDFFPLQLGHTALACNACHKSGSYTGLSPACYSCHQNDFLGTNNPNHVSSQFSQVCSNCHTLAPGWKPASFDHSKFPLVQGHSIPACADCHKSGNYTNTSADCYSCHKSNFDSSTDPNHNLAGFSTACATCHSLNPGWKPATFNHSKFPLTLGHSTPACIDCHKGSGSYASTPTDCYACHQANYVAANNPNHVSAGFPTVCLTCHTTNPGWTPATYDHSKFPLTLGHAAVTCNACHTNGNYSAISTDCYTCHKTDYTNTANPSHSVLAFSTVCTQCHTTNPGWQPATYAQHDSQFFPIYSGRHNGAWTTCADCHDNASSYASFTCISCHTHNKTDMDNAHQGRTGYSYTSTACLNCHPRGTTN